MSHECVLPSLGAPRLSGTLTEPPPVVPQLASATDAATTRSAAVKHVKPPVMVPVGGCHTANVKVKEKDDGREGAAEQTHFLDVVLCWSWGMIC